MAIVKTGSGRHSVAPILNLDFAKSKSLPSKISFSRNSVATYYDSDGVVRFATHNEPRFDHDPSTGESKGLLVEKASVNWTRASEHIHMAPWGVNGACYAVPNAGVAPDGTYSATRLVFTASSQAYSINNNSGTTPWSVGATVSTTFWVKGVSGEVLNVATGGQDTYHTLTGEWQRIVAIGTSLNTYTNINTYGASTARDILIWGAQAEPAEYATSYVPSQVWYTGRTSRATYYDEKGILRVAQKDQPRYGYKWDATTQRFLETKLQLEPSATNLFTYAGIEGPSNIIAVTGSTTKTNNALAPDGTYSAVRITWTNGYAYRYFPNVLGDSTPVAMSFYFKPISGTPRFAAGGSFGSFGFTFDVAAGTVAFSAPHANTTEQRAEIIDIGNGWYRIEVNFTSSGASGYTEIQWAGSGSADYYIWGVQVEDNSRTCSSFIYTAGASETRSADVAQFAAYTRDSDNLFIDGQKFKDFYNYTQGTWFAEADTVMDVVDIDNRADTIYVGDGSTNNAVYAGPNSVGSSNTIYLYSTKEGTPQIAITSGLSGQKDYKFAYSYKLNDIALSVNGSAVGQDNTAQLTNYADRVYFGSRYGASQWQNGHLRKIAYYDKQLSDAELQALTENN
jgi:hypothetical protein